MKCNHCGRENPEENLYCEQCGQKIDMARDRVHDELSQKVEQQAEKALEEQTRTALVICLFIFALALTARVTLVSNHWPKKIILPSSTNDASEQIQRYRKSMEDLKEDENNWHHPPVPEEK